MPRKPMLIDDNVEDIRRVRHEISSQFKTFDEFWEYALKVQEKGLKRRRREHAVKNAHKAKLAAAKVNSAKPNQKVI